MQPAAPDKSADPTLPHKLAAILYADVAGYSRLTGEDEAGTHRTLSAYLDLFSASITAHRGEVKHYAGDAVLADFSTVSDALNCAVAAQRELKRRNVALAADKRVEFRIGLNLGEVIVDRGEVYGNGVNVAARLQALAEPGGICISGAAHDAIGNKLPLGYDYLGEHKVKNIAKPVRAYRVDFSGESAAGKPAVSDAPRKKRKVLLIAALAALLAIAAALAWNWALVHSRRDDPILALPKGPAIAVLPFANLSGDPAQEYFSDGITEQIISELARFRGLYVVARNSTFQFKGRAQDVRDIGRQLGARYVLEGSVRRSGDTLRVTAQLLDAASGSHLWAETYDRPATGGSIFALQDDITERVVASIAGPYGQISQFGLEQATRKGPQSIDSYDCVLRAYVWNRVLSREGHGPLRDCLEAAVKRDPNYGEAWAWLAFSYLFEYESGYNPRPEQYDARDRALEVGHRAVELDPNNAVVHANMSYVRFLRREFDASLASAERALQLNPNDPAVLCQAGQKMVYSGIQIDRGLALTRKAMALGPHYPTWCHFHLSWHHYRKREYDQGLAEALKLNMPDLFWTQVFLAMNYGQLGREQEAKAALAQLAKLYPEFGKHARREWSNYIFTDAGIEHANEGLRKAGLNIAP